MSLLNLYLYIYTFVIYSEEQRFIAQSAFHSVPLPTFIIRKESKNGPLPHFADFILLSLLRSSSLQQIFAVSGIFFTSATQYLSANV